MVEKYVIFSERYLLYNSRRQQIDDTCTPRFLIHYVHFTVTLYS